MAEAFGCSPNTVSRTVKAALSPEDYEQLKQQRAKGVLQGAAGALGVAATAVAKAETVAAELGSALEAVPAVAAPLAPEAEPITPATLALDDADDFSNDQFDDEDIEAELEADLNDGTSDNDPENSFVALPPITVRTNLDDGRRCVSKPLRADQLPASLYLLVDREVELKGTPVKEFSELGQLAPGEELLQAIALFSNPRQAKRQCGRSQRVIKLPDPSLLERTAPYILAQGISRIVLEGSLYAIPGSPSLG
ncbi:MAG: helix-turn-helix domain-containing protein [Synechococcus lacustris]